MSCSTGDETLDEMLAGGVPEGRTLLVRGPRRLLPTASGEQLARFFGGAADQVVRTWRDSDGLQYLSIPRSATGSPGYTRVVEPTADPPYVRLR